MIYHSPLTTLTIIRVSRPHLPLLHSSIVLLRSINGRAVIPRVIGVSGTIKRCCHRGMVHHRVVSAGYPGAKSGECYGLGVWGVAGRAQGLMGSERRGV